MSDSKIISCNRIVRNVEVLILEQMIKGIHLDMTV